MGRNDVTSSNGGSAIGINGERAYCHRLYGPILLRCYEVLMQEVDYNSRSRAEMLRAIIDV